MFLSKKLKSNLGIEYEVSYGNKTDNPEIAQEHNIGERIIMYYRVLGTEKWVKWAKDSGVGFVKWLEDN